MGSHTHTSAHPHTRTHVAAHWSIIQKDNWHEFPIVICKVTLTQPKTWNADWGRPGMRMWSARGDACHCQLTACRIHPHSPSWSCVHTVYWLRALVGGRWCRRVAPWGWRPEGGAGGAFFFLIISSFFFFFFRRVLSLNPPLFFAIIKITIIVIFLLSLLRNFCLIWSRCS